MKQLPDLGKLFRRRGAGNYILVGMPQDHFLVGVHLDRIFVLIAAECRGDILLAEVVIQPELIQILDLFLIKTLLGKQAE